MRESSEQLRIRLLYEQSILSHVTSLLNIGVFTYVTYQLPNHGSIVAWAIAGIGLLLFRFSLKYAFKTRILNSGAHFSPSRWETYFCISAALGGLYWTIPGTLLVGRELVNYQVFIGFILAGNTAGAAVAYASSVRAVLSFLIPALLPFIINLSLQNDAFHHGMAALTALYLLMLSMIVTRVNRYIVDSIELRFEKDDLLTSLKQSHSQMMHSEKMAALGTMAGGIAHEINTPLASINLTMDVIGEDARSGTLDPKYIEKMAKEVNETVFKIAKIIASMRSFSQDGDAPTFEPIRVRSIVEDTLVLCNSRLIGGGMGVNVNPIPSNLYVSGNSSELSQMLMNLLNNAADATKGVPNGNVKIEVRASNETVSIVVTDNGRGIPEAIRGKIMQPFFTTKEVGKGTGLGLSMALGIMEAHGGKLELDTTARGTCFVATLPRIQAQQAKAVS